MKKDNKNIIWLASYPKSGNTWIRIILENLMYPDRDFDLNNMKIAKHANSRILFDDYSGTASTDLTEREIRTLLPEVYRRISAESEGFVFLKTHEAWKRKDEINSIYLKEISKAAVYIIRNPLDIAISFSHHSNKETKDIIKDMNSTESGFCKKHDRIFNQLEQIMLDWSENVLSWTEHSNLPIITIKYEDLLENTFKEIKELISFIGLNFSNSEIKEAIKKSDFKSLSEIEDEQGFKEKPLKMKKFFREGRSGNWESILCEQDYNAIIFKHEDTMRKFGYLD